MSKKRVLPRLEVILIVVFFVSFVLWAMRKCSEDRALYVEEHAEIEEALPDTTTNLPVTSLETPAETETPAEIVTQRRNTRSAAEQPGRRIKERYTPLYVTIENLNMRDAVGLNGKILDRLKLYDEVTFLNEVTDSIYEINLGGLVTHAPWIKVKSPKGKVGWVYGAGVHYYKKRLEGVE